MNADRLITLFDRVADVPDAVPKLRNFVLDLAVRGRLVDQNPNEEPASELLKQLKAERRRLLELGEIKESRAQSTGKGLLPPFEVPSTWVLVPLRNAVILINGRAFKPTDWTPRGLPIVRIQNLNNPSAPFNRFDGNIRERFLIKDEDLLISWSGTPGTSFGAHIWNRGPAILNQHIFRSVLVANVFVKKFLKIAINGRLYELIGQAHGGVGLQHITKPKLESLSLALPPLAEQHRIVTKVDELMAICDKLEESQARREQTRDRLTNASFAKLSEADADRETFRAHARFAINVLPKMTVRPDQIDKLRQTILDLAVRGKLVDQDPNDEPACELLRRIAKRRQQEPSSRKEQYKEESDSVESRIPLPSKWESVELCDLLRVINGRAYKKTELLDSGTPVLRVGNLFTSNKWYYSDLKLGRDKYCDCGDLIFAWSASFGPFIWPGPRVIYHYHIWKLLLYSESDVDKYFVYYLLRQRTGEIKRAGHGVSMIHMTKKKMEQLRVSLPPLAEQRRIVAKINELFEIIEKLALGVSAAQEQESLLLSSLIDEVLAASEETQE